MEEIIVKNNGKYFKGGTITIQGKTYLIEDTEEIENKDILKLYVKGSV